MATKPTPITDKNGKQTTVHRRIALASKGNQRVSGVNNMPSPTKKFNELSVDTYASQIINTFGLEQIDKSEIKPGDNILVAKKDGVTFGTAEIDNDVNNTYRTETISVAGIYVIRREYSLEKSKDETEFYEYTPIEQMAVYR